MVQVEQGSGGLFGDEIGPPPAGSCNSPKKRGENKGGPPAQSLFAEVDQDAMATPPVGFETVRLAAEFLGESELVAQVPRSLENFVTLYGLEKTLRVGRGGVRDKEPQRACATLFQEFGESLLIQSPTGSGKTFLALQALAPELANNKVVLFMTPDHLLVDQIAKDCEKAYYSDRVTIDKVTGDLSAKKREALYQEFCDGSNQQARIIIATPEAILNDLQNGRLSAAAFSAVVFDEAHYAVGKYAYVEIAEHLKQIGLKKKLCLSAFPAKNESELEALKERLGADRFIVLKSDKQEPARAQEVVCLPDKMAKARDLIEQAMDDVVRGIVHGVNHDVPRENLELRANAKEVIKQLRAIVVRKGKIVPPVAGDTEKFTREFQELFDTAKEMGLIKELGPVRSLVAELGYLRHCHMTLTSHGQYEFMDHVARDLAGLRFSGKGQSYHKRVLEQRKETREAFDLIASGTPYEKLRQFKSWEQVAGYLGAQQLLPELNKLLARTPFRKTIQFDSWRETRKSLIEREDIRAALESVTEDKDIRELLKARNRSEIDQAFRAFCPDTERTIKQLFFDEHTFDFMVNRSESNHPKEQALRRWLGTDPRVRGKGGALVKTDQGNQARFLAARLKKWGFDSQWIAGQKHLKRADVQENLESFTKNPSSVLVITSVGTHGLHIGGCTMLMILSPVATVKNLVQLEGRIGREDENLGEKNKKTAGIVVTLCVSGSKRAPITQDLMRHTTTKAQRKRHARKAESSTSNMLFPVSN